MIMSAGNRLDLIQGTEVLFWILILSIGNDMTNRFLDFLIARIKSLICLDILSRSSALNGLNGYAINHSPPSSVPLEIVAAPRSNRQTVTGNDMVG
jgi:hypothetical protein